ncbi:MAG TPA: cytochrome c maturation protein CcmE [Clostridia bacterium]|nr:cytochrome c maturation protein CcmE [Clostridia bacterium]
MSKKVKMSIGLLVIVGAMAYLMVAGFSGNAGFQVSISDLVLNGDNYAGEYLLVEGKVLPETIEWNGEQIELRFLVTDGQYQLPIIYYDVAPDNLDYEGGAEAILRGRYDHGAGVFVADTVETRCPSKYEAAEE